eukprot:3846465-Pyramimonas_sp.AAC.1
MERRRSIRTSKTKTNVHGQKPRPEVQVAGQPGGRSRSPHRQPVRWALDARSTSAFNSPICVDMLVGNLSKLFGEASWTLSSLVRSTPGSRRSSNRSSDLAPLSEHQSGRPDV